MRKILLLLIPLLAVLFCTAQDNYFPQKAFSDDGWSGQFKADWYSNELKVLERRTLPAAEEGERSLQRILSLPVAGTSLHPSRFASTSAPTEPQFSPQKLAMARPGFPTQKLRNPFKKYRGLSPASRPRPSSDASRSRASGPFRVF